MESVAKLHQTTPVWESIPLSRAAGVPVRLKMEALQPIGSFKIRGIGALCQHLAAKGSKRFISSSGGNAGYAAAYAGRRLGVPVTVVVPETTSPAMRERIRAEGADVVVKGAVWDEANDAALALAEESGDYISPFEHPLIWSGHASLVDELTGQCDKPDLIVVSVGGGGLLCGVLEGLHRNRWHDVPVLTAETEGAASFAASMEAGRLVTLETINSVATSLGARRISSRALDWTRDHDLHACVMPDDAAINACLRFADDHRTMVEPACGAALAPVYEAYPEIRDATSVLVVVCGGANVDLRTFCKWRGRRSTTRC